MTFSPPIEISQELLFSCTPDGTILTARPNCAFVLGWPEDEFITKPLSDLVHPEEQKQLLDLLKNYDSEKPIHPIQIRILHKEGAYRTFSLRLSGNTKSNAIFGSAIDITTLCRTEGDKLKIQTQLFQTEKLIVVEMFSTRIFRALTHALATTDEKTKQLLEPLKDQMAAYANLEGDDNQDIDLAKLITDTCALLKTLYSKLNISLSYTSDRIRPITGNQGLLQQLLVNLISRARYATEGQATRSIRIHAREEGAFVVVEISDNGYGSSAEKAAKILKPYLESNGANKGTDVSLSLTLDAIQGMGGHFSVNAEPSGGTRFAAFLPRLASPLQAETNSTGKSPSLTNGAPLSALVIDDEEELRFILRDYLERQGIVVTEAEDGIDALEKVKTAHFDLIFTDQRMPRMDGSKFLSEVVKNNLAPNAKFIIASGGTVTDYIKSAPEVGAAKISGYLRKPFSSAEVLAVLKNLTGASPQLK